VKPILFVFMLVKLMREKLVKILTYSLKD